MKERPIRFSGEMVRAILEGRKTATRRVVKPTRYQNAYVRKKWPHWKPTPEEWNDMAGKSASMKVCQGVYECPYGQPGDRLWVRETWLPRNSGKAAIYRADHTEGVASGISGMYSDHGWRPSIYMPRWASRITLEVTGGRVERVQEIDEVGAILEGMIYGPFWKADKNENPKNHFKHLWDSLNAKSGFGWDKNHWVWVVEFKRVSDGH